MRIGLVLFWAAMAVLEIARRWNPGAVAWLGRAGPWVVTLFTLLPALSALRDFRDRRPVEAVKSLLWVIPGLITLLLGPRWLRF